MACAGGWPHTQGGFRAAQCDLSAVMCLPFRSISSSAVSQLCPQPWRCLWGALLLCTHHLKCWHLLCLPAVVGSEVVALMVVTVVGTVVALASEKQDLAHQQLNKTWKSQDCSCMSNYDNETMFSHLQASHTVQTFQRLQENYSLSLL